MDVCLIGGKTFPDSQHLSDLGLLSSSAPTPLDSSRILHSRPPTSLPAIGLLRNGRSPFVYMDFCLFSPPIRSPALWTSLYTCSPVSLRKIGGRQGKYICARAAAPRKVEYSLCLLPNVLFVYSDDNQEMGGRWWPTGRACGCVPSDGKLSVRKVSARQVNSHQVSGANDHKVSCQ